MINLLSNYWEKRKRKKELLRISYDHCKEKYDYDFNPISFSKIIGEDDKYVYMRICYSMNVKPPSRLFVKKENDMKNRTKLVILLCSFIALTLIALFGWTFSSLVKDMNQAESVNHVLFEISREIREFHQENGHFPSSFEDLKQKPNEKIDRIKKLDHCFLVSNKNYVFIVKVNDKYYSAIKNKKDNFQPAMLNKDDIPENIFLENSKENKL